MEREPLNSSVFTRPPDVGRNTGFAAPPQGSPAGGRFPKLPKLPKPARKPKAPQARWGPTTTTGTPAFSPSLPEPAKRSLRATLSGISWAARLGLAIGLGGLLAVGLRLTVLEGYHVPSESMSPALHTDDRIITEKLSYILGTPKRGHVIVFEAGPGWNQDPTKSAFVKRVVATAGETVRCCDAKGRIVVNKIPVNEKYTRGRTAPFKKVKVPAGHLFVMGDNREDSADSRVRGPVPVDAVTARVLLRTWPLNRIGFLPGP